MAAAAWWLLAWGSSWARVLPAALQVKGWNGAGGKLVVRSAGPLASHSSSASSSPARLLRIGHVIIRNSGLKEQVKSREKED